MKDYKEMAESVYSAVREENFRKAKRAGIIRKAVPCCCVCGAVFAAAVVIGNSGRNVNLNPENYHMPNAAPEESTADETGVKYQYEFEGYTELTDVKYQYEFESYTDFTEDQKAEDQPDETTDKFVQIGWIEDAEGNTYPATVERDQEPSDADLISYGVKPSDTDKILKALNYCFDNKTGSVTDHEGVKVISYSPEKYYNVYAECSMGEEVYALKDGKVIETGYLGANGYTVRVADNDGKVISYCCLSKVNVAKGDTVTKNQAVGFAGTSGLTSHIGAKYIISSLDDTLDQNTGYANRWDYEVSFVSDPVANQEISTKDTDKILNAINDGNSFGSSIDADTPTKDITLDNGIKVRVFAHHTDLLLNTRDNEDIYAITGGTVSAIGHCSSFNCGSIEILTDSGEWVTYYHLGELCVDIDDMIEEGQLLGKSGKFEGEPQASVLYSIREK